MRSAIYTILAASRARPEARALEALRAHIAAEGLAPLYAVSLVAVRRWDARAEGDGAFVDDGVALLLREAGPGRTAAPETFPATAAGVAAATAPAEAQYRRYYRGDRGAAIGAGIALGILGLGAAAIQTLRN